MPYAAARLIESDVFQRLVLLRRDLHQHPELSWQEQRTANQICRFLDELEIEYRRDVAGTGILAEVAGRNDGPCVALRADMDALPIKEETGLPFDSQAPGVMHACGHDGHTSMLLGAATLLAGDKPPPAPVRLIFQPAEENRRGSEGDDRRRRAGERGDDFWRPCRSPLPGRFDRRYRRRGECFERPIFDHHHRQGRPCGTSARDD